MYLLFILFFVFNFSPTDYITHMAICNHQLVLGMRNKIKRMDLMNPEVSDGIFISLFHVCKYIV